MAGLWEPDVLLTVEFAGGGFTVGRGDVSGVVSAFGTRVEEDLRTLANHLEGRVTGGTGDVEVDEDGVIDGEMVAGMEIGGGDDVVVGCGWDRSGVCCSSCIGDSARGTTFVSTGKVCSLTGEVTKLCRMTFGGQFLHGVSPHRDNALDGTYDRIRLHSQPSRFAAWECEQNG